MLGRIATFLLIATIVVIAGAYFFNWQITIPEGVAQTIGWRQDMSDEDAIRADVQMANKSSPVEAKVRDALDRNDIDDASMYSEIAGFAGIELSEQTTKDLEDAQSFISSAVRNTGDYIGGFVFGTGTSFASLAGSITSDLTVVGDVRDIVGEGSKMVAGEEYSELILGLSVLGVAATAAVVASGGGGIVVKAGLSMLKFAKRAGTLTVEFGTRLARMARDAVNFPLLERTLRQTDLSDLGKVEEAVSNYVRNVRTAEIFPVVSRLDDLRQATNVGESVRLMKYVRTTDDLENLTSLARVTGTKTRGIVEMTGKIALRAFKYTVNIIRFIIENILAFLTWLGTLLTTSLGKRVLRGRRTATA